MNIVLVMFDSYRKDCFGLYGKPFWGEVKTPHLDALARESLVFDHAYPESLPTLPARRAIYTGRQVFPFDQGDFRLKGDFVGSAGWGPIPEAHPTLAEMLGEAGYRTGLVADVYHMFKPSKNYTRGFHQWTFLRGQETDPYRSGPTPTQAQIERYLPREMQLRADFMRTCLKNMHGRQKEEDYFNARVFIEAARWLEQNQDAENFFLTVESFDPHEPWFVPDHYLKMYGGDPEHQQASSWYDTFENDALLRLTQINYSALCTMCDRWFQHFYETMRNMGLLKNTLLIVTADHGHSIGDHRFLGKRGYPSDPSVFDIPLIIRRPEGLGAGQRTNYLVQHHDITAEILKVAGVEPPEPIDGQPFLDAALAGEPSPRDHATVAWGGAVTVTNTQWWMTCKVDGTGPFLYEREGDPHCERNVAQDHAEVVNHMFAAAMRDAGGSIPDYLLELARSGKDAPGCSEIAARPV